MPVTAAVVGDGRVGAVLATRDMSAERRRAAALDRRHHLELAEGYVAGIGFTPSRSIVAEDVRDLQRWTGHERRGLCGRLVLLELEGNLLQRAHDFPDRLGGDAGVDLGGRRVVEYQ